MATIGHNSAGAPPEDDDAVSFRFVDLHLGDWIGGTSGFGCELEGAYIRFLTRLYQHGKPFVDDEKNLAARMGLSVRVWRRLREELLSLGKITLRNGCLTNKRFETERLKRAAQIRKQADGARDRWKNQRTSAEVSPEFPETSGKVSPKLPAKTNGHVNKFNDLIDGQPVSPIPNTHSQYPKENTPPQQSHPASAGGVKVEEITGLNGATVLMIDTLAGWINPLMPKKREAREWLNGRVKIFGSDVVKASFAEVQGKYAEGDIVARPIILMTKICQRLAETKSKTGGGLPSVRPSHVPEHVWRKIQEDEAKAAAAR